VSKKSLKKLICIGLELVLVLGITVFMGTAANAAKQVTIRLWHGFNAWEIKHLEDEIVNRFYPDHPNIRVKTLAPISPEKMLTAVAGGNPPEVVIFWGPTPIGAWVRMGAVECIDDQIKRSKLDLGVFVPAGLKWCRYKGKYYALPFVLFNSSLYWNKDLFRNAGLNPNEPPKTFKELAEYAKKLTKYDASGEHLLTVGIYPQVQFPFYAYAFGGKFFSKDGRTVTANDPNNIKALEYTLALSKEFGLKKLTKFAAGFGKGGAADNPFYLNKLAMSIEGDWQVRYIERYAPSLNYGVGPFPAPADAPERRGTTIVYTNPILIPKGCKHFQEAWELMKWLATDPKVAAEYSHLVANIPQIKSVVETFTDDPRERFFAKLALGPNAHSLEANPIMEKYLDIRLPAVTEKVYNLQMTPKEALDKLTIEMQKELDKYLK